MYLGRLLSVCFSRCYLQSLLSFHLFSVLEKVFSAFRQFFALVLDGECLKMFKRELKFCRIKFKEFRFNKNIENFSRTASKNPRIGGSGVTSLKIDFFGFLKYQTALILSSLLHH